MYPRQLFHYEGFYGMRMESSRDAGFLKLGFDKWLPLYFLFCAIAAWEVKRMIVIFLNRCPQNVKIAGMDSIVGRWITSLRYCYAAQSVHSKAYAEGGGKPYAIPARSRYHVCVSSQKLVEELTNASIHHVSLRDALWERAFPEQTIDGLKVDNMDQNGSLSQKTFRHHARLHLPSLQPLLRRRLEEAFATEIDSHERKHGWTHVYASSAISRITAKINNVILVGDDLANNSGFFEEVVRYVHYAAICEEILQFTPQFLFPLMGWIIMKSTRVTQNVKKYLIPLAAKRLDDPVLKEQEPKDTVQWIINSQKKATAEDVAQQALAYIFGSAYQMPMLVSFAMYNLCKHPEHLQPLREEILRSGEVLFNHQNNELPLLDSFLKETARLNPVTIFSMPRKTMAPFTFSDGTHVPANNWIVVPQQAQMKDPANYAEPEKFVGFRFVTHSREGAASESRFSHPSWRFPFWGSVKQACPARFYVTDMTKLIISQFVMNYDFKLADESLPSSFAWGVVRIPHPYLAFSLKKREAVEGSGRSICLMQSAGET